MKISIPNIITALFFICSIIFLSFGIWVFSTKIFSVNHEFEYGDVIALLFLLTFEIFFLYMLIFKFKISRIDTVKITAFYPFLWKQKEILWNDLYKIECSTFVPSRSLRTYRKVIIKSRKGKGKIVEIPLVDWEIENFDSFTNAIPNGKKIRQKIDKKQAREDVVFDTIGMIFLIGAVLFLLYEVLFTEKNLIVLLLIVVFFCIQTIRETLRVYKVLEKI